MNPTRRTLLKSIAVSASVATSGQIEGRRAKSLQTADSSAGLKSNLNSLIGTLRIGTEFFLNKTETKQGIDRHFRLMRDTGLTLVRIFIIWDDIEHIPDAWDFERYDWIYDAAAANGIKVVATLCSEDPPGWTRETPFYHNRTNLNDPAIRRRAAVYIEKTVGRYKGHAAQGVWLLMNEPSKYDAEPATLRAFGAWLEKKYRTVDALNRSWFRQVKSFADVTLTPDQLTGGNYGWLDYPPVIDWREFNIDNLVDQLLWIKGQVELHDRNHPTHLNVTSPLGGPSGQDAWKEEKIVDILGASLHPAWMFPPEAPRSKYGEIFAYRLDLIASPSGSKPWWVTELQSGPTVFTGRFPLNPEPEDITRWLWDSYGAGAKGVIFWLWQPRSGGQEGGEWGLVSLDGKPSIRVPAVKAVAESLQRNPFLAEARRQPAKAAILYNRETAIINNLEGTRMQHRGDEWERSLNGCYMALHRAHIPVEFVDLDQLKQGIVNGFQVLYIPYSYAMDDAAVRAIREFVMQGGCLFADGLAAWKTDTGGVRPSIPGNLSEVFGVEAFDIYPVKVDEPYSVTDRNELGGELWKLPLEIKGAEVFLRDREGKPFGVKHRMGKGRVIYYESALTLAYAKRSHPLVQKWIIEPALATLHSIPVYLAQGSERVTFRGMLHPAGPVAILSNWGETEKVAVSFRGEYTVAEILSGAALSIHHEQGITLAAFTLRARSAAILRAEKTKTV
jgi:beta-galactosidase